MSLFRKKALDALSTPENLREPMRLLSPSLWVTLISLIGFGGYILFWSVFGALPIRVKGRGILYSPNSMYISQPEVPARIKNILVDVGDCISKNTILAELDVYKLELAKNQIKSTLDKLISDSDFENRLESAQLELKESKYNRYAQLKSNDAISKMKFEEIALDFRTLKAQLIKQKIRREQSILSKELELEKLNNQITKSSLITSKVDGCIVGSNIKLGQVVNPGDRVFEIRSEFESSSLTSYAFLPTKDVKRLKIGQPVKITPTTIKKQRHGGITGTILTINPLPISKEDLFTKFANDSIVSKIHNSKSEPVIQITTTLDKDKDSISGYDWGGGKGPNLNLTSGTMTDISVIVEKRKPITYVIPLLRDLTGIY